MKRKGMHIALEENEQSLKKRYRMIKKL